MKIQLSSQEMSIFILYLPCFWSVFESFFDPANSFLRWYYWSLSLRHFQKQGSVQHDPLQQEAEYFVHHGLGQQIWSTSRETELCSTETEVHSTLSSSIGVRVFSTVEAFISGSLSISKSLESWLRDLRLNVLSKQMKEQNHNYLFKSTSVF